MTDRKRQLRWRMVLGKGAEQMLGGISDSMWAKREQTLGYLYDREYGSGRNVRSKSREGNLAESVLSVPDWINAVHELFPKDTIERLEKDALERYKLEEMMTNPDVLKRAQPSESLLKAVIRTKHLMNQEVLEVARVLVKKVVEQLLEKLARQISSPFTGSRDRNRRSFLKVAKNFDAKTTIRRNLAHYDSDKKRLFIETPYFFSRIRRHVDRWQLIILVDQSGSMVGSVIHSAITASIFKGISSLKTHLVAFDTSVVDLSDCADDPVETLMKVQLGGGTDIGHAVAYGAGLVENPRKTIIILISDFYEGASEYVLYSACRKLLESGVTILGLAALDESANPVYDKDVARRLVNMGAHVGAMTPGELAKWVAEKVK